MVDDAEQETCARNEFYHCGRENTSKCVAKLAIFCTGSTGSTRRIPKKRQISDDGDNLYEVLEQELAYKNEARKWTMQLRREDIELNKESWEEDKKDRKHNWDQSNEKLKLFSALST